MIVQSAFARHLFQEFLFFIFAGKAELCQFFGWQAAGAVRAKRAHFHRIITVDHFSFAVRYDGNAGAQMRRDHIERFVRFMQFICDRPRHRAAVQGVQQTHTGDLLQSGDPRHIVHFINRDRIHNKGVHTGAFCQIPGDQSP